MVEAHDIAELLRKYIDSTRVLPNGTVYYIKAFVCLVKDLKVVVYPKDHENQPHFHVISKQRNIDARFDLHTLECISLKRGKISVKDIKKIKSFFREHPDALRKLKATHEELNP